MHLLIADDHPIILAGLSHLVRSKLGWDVSVVTNSADALDALTNVKTNLFLSDVVMSGGCIFEVIRKARKILPELSIALFSGHLSDVTLKKAFTYGVSGVVSKEDTHLDVIDCLTHLARGESFYSVKVKDRMLDSVVFSQNAHRPRLRLMSLSSRELEVLKCIGNGFPNAMIAEDLDISIKTVNRHKSSIMDKLAIRSSSELMKYALREGISTI